MKYFGVKGAFLVSSAKLIPIEALKPRVSEPAVPVEEFTFDGGVSVEFTLNLSPKQSEKLVNCFDMTFEDAPAGTMPEMN